MTEEEYREALRLIGYPLLPDAEAFRPPPPLPPDLKSDFRFAPDDGMELVPVPDDVYEGEGDDGSESE